MRSETMKSIFTDSPKKTMPSGLTAIYAAVALLTVSGLIIAAKNGPPRPGKSAKAAKSAKSRKSSASPLAGVTVILDPGHGGIDSGSICSGVREDALNYRLTATIAAALKASGANIVYTIRSKALAVPLAEGQNEPPLIIPADGRLAFDNGTIIGNKKSLGARAAIGIPYWDALPNEKKITGRGLYFLAVHHDECPGVRGARIEFDKRSGQSPLLATVLTRRVGAQSFDTKLAAWCRSVPDARHLWVLKPTNNPVMQRALLEAATISNPLDRDLANSRQFRWKIARTVRDSIIECEKTLKSPLQLSPAKNIQMAQQTPAKPKANASLPDRSLIAARRGAAR